MNIHIKLLFAMATGLAGSLTLNAHCGNSNETAIRVRKCPDMTISAHQGSFEASDGTFLLNGKPFVIKAAEMHYPRIPHKYWDHRIKMCKALGMNTICLYTFWNVHESTPDNFNFEGQNDLAGFVRLCKDNDMYVILRPGPYVCAEWEMGGLPWWLLKKKDIRLRENDPYFLERVDKFQKAVADQLKGLTIADGGPIIMIQVENEYGSYGTDKAYISNIRDMLRRNFGNEVTLFQCDWSSNFLNNGLEDLIWTLNFGTGADIDRQFEPLRQVRPDSPMMCSEFWSGWFDKWGNNHETRPADQMTEGISEMLDKNISFSLYMTHGGTNWGHWAGANSPGFAPDVTSYDYDAPISESGAATPKYHALRATLAKYSDKKLPAVPDGIPTTTIKAFDFKEVAPVFKNLPEPRHDKEIKTMEEYDQGFGSIIYSTTLPEIPQGATLVVNEPHDYAQVFINGIPVGKLDRRLDEKTLGLPAFKAGARLDILVEAMGRINFGRAIKDFKGITDDVALTFDKDGYTYNYVLKNWDVYNLPDELSLYENMHFEPVSNHTHDKAGRLPAGVYRAKFNVKKPGDTFINMESWGKGLVYVNGHALGRFWEIGPQQTLYLPGCWLKKGENDIIVFDVTGPRNPRTEGLDSPITDKLMQDSPLTHRKDCQKLDLTGEKAVIASSFAPGHGWQKIDFGKEIRGRYVALEFLNAMNGGDNASIAELYLLDGDGNRLSREPWIVLYADAEDVTDGNHTADKIFDLQESTYWSTGNSSPFPHSMVIDLGAAHTISGLEYLPRMEADMPGAVKDFKVYVKPTDFTY